MKRTINTMHRGLRKAVVNLRAAKGWGQEDLAKEMCRMAMKMGVPIKPNQVSVSRWEKGEVSPNEDARIVLARIAATDESTKDLAALFRLPVAYWRIFGRVIDDE